jgi:hypothetical protein
MTNVLEKVAEIDYIFYDMTRHLYEFQCHTKL